MLPSKKYNRADENPSSDQFLQLNKAKNDQQKPSLGDQIGAIDNLYFDFDSPPYQNLIKGEKIHIPSSNTVGNDLKLSTIERIRMAGLHFINSYSSNTRCKLQSRPSVTLFIIPGLSNDEAKDINLILILLASADKTSQQQYDEANKLVELCNSASSNEGTTIQRLVYYFSEAIREKINHETGRGARDGLMKMFDLQKALMGIDASILAFHQKVSLSQVCQFTSMYTIPENLGRARHVHVNYLEIRSGMQHTVLMQAIASRSEWQLKHMKITAIGTRSKSNIKDTCNHLADFARSKNIPFSFKIIMVPDMLDFNIHILELDRKEKIAVYSSVSLSSLAVTPNCLEHLMQEIRKINPCVTVVTEVEANHTSVTFVNHFIDALFFYGALFNSVSVCLGDDEPNRKVAESVYNGYTIQNIVAADGDDRTVRHTGIDVWRVFFGRFGMVEVEFSGESLNEATLLIDNFKCGICCKLCVDGRCFIVDWNGVSIFSISAWKFT